MKNSPIQQTSDQIVIDKVKVESLTKRFLAAVKAFFIKIITQPEWDRMGLENTWRFFLPLVIILVLMCIHYASYFLGIGTLVVTAIWLWRSRK